MATYIFRAAAVASFFRPATLPVIHKFRTLRPVAVLVRYAARRASMPGSDRPRDRDISHRVVQLVNEDGRLDSPTSLSHLLASIDLQTHYIELVTEVPQPIVKIRNKQEQYRKQKEWAKRQKEVAANNVQKEIQMTWGVASGDLAHKLNKTRKELEKGNRVQLVFAPKANQPVPNQALMEARINEISGKIAEFAREWMPRKFQSGVAIFYLKKLDSSSKPTEPS